MMRLADVAGMLKTPLMGDDAAVNAVTTDTRTLEPGDLFVALKGPNFDGHDFTVTAQEKGASGMLVSDSVKTTLPYIKARNTTLALGSFATEWRRQFDIPVVAITGSNGKTTVKQMTGAILAAAFGKGVVSAGNFNNHIGLPLSVLRLREQDGYGVFELGMSNAGEIDYLSRVAGPTVAVVANASEAHLQGFSDLEAIARAKGEIFDGMDMDGIAIINADDQFTDFWRQLAGTRRCIRFAIDADAEVTGSFTPEDGGSQIAVNTPLGSFEAFIKLPGRHNVANALAATAAAVALEIAPDDIAKGLSEFEPEGGRLEHTDLGDARAVINDAYNANPASVRAAIDVLAAHPGTRILVLGDMAELGPNAPALHHSVGESARAAGIDRLCVHGDLSVNIAEGFGNEAKHFADIDELIENLCAYMSDAKTPVTVLVKGSRSMRMERVVAGVTNAFGKGESTC